MDQIREKAEKVATEWFKSTYEDVEQMKDMLAAQGENVDNTSLLAVSNAEKMAAEGQVRLADLIESVFKESS
jgi:hypothetical protein